MNSDYTRAFAQEVAREINAEASRQGIRTARAFTRLVGSTNHTSWTKKLSPHAANFVPMTMVDLATASRALKVEPSEILRRAEHAADWATLGEGWVEEVATRAAQAVLGEQSPQDEVQTDSA